MRRRLAEADISYGRPFAIRQSSFSSAAVSCVKEEVASFI